MPAGIAFLVTSQSYLMIGLSNVGSLIISKQLQKTKKNNNNHKKVNKSVYAAHFLFKNDYHFLESCCLLQSCYVSNIISSHPNVDQTI